MRVAKNWTGLQREQRLRSVRRELSRRIDLKSTTVPETPQEKRRHTMNDKMLRRLFNELAALQGSCDHTYRQVDRGPTWVLRRCAKCGAEAFND